MLGLDPSIFRKRFSGRRRAAPENDARGSPQIASVPALAAA